MSEPLSCDLVGHLGGEAVDTVELGRLLDDVGVAVSNADWQASEPLSDKLLIVWVELAIAWAVVLRREAGRNVGQLGGEGGGFVAVNVNGIIQHGAKVSDVLGGIGAKHGRLISAQCALVMVLGRVCTRCMGKQGAI